METPPATRMVQTYSWIEECTPYRSAPASITARAKRERERGGSREGRKGEGEGEGGRDRGEAQAASTVLPSQGPWHSALVLPRMLTEATREGTDVTFTECLPPEEEGKGEEPSA